MKTVIRYGMGIILFLITTNSVYAAQDLEDGIQELAKQISTNMSTSNKKKIAIIEFSNLSGNITEFGQFLAEELITQLFLESPGQFEVVERRQIMKVLAEQKLTMSGLLDSKAMESVGKILGIEAIVTGSVTDLGSNVKVNARMIGVDNAKIFAVASSKIPKVDIVRELMEKEVIPMEVSVARQTDVVGISPGQSNRQTSVRNNSIPVKSELSNEEREELFMKALILRGNKPELFMKARGVFIGRIDNISLARKIGLKLGDIILFYDDDWIYYFSDLATNVSNSEVSRKYNLLVLRNETLIPIRVRGGKLGIGAYILE